MDSQPNPYAPLRSDLEAEHVEHRAPSPFSAGKLCLASFFLFAGSFGVIAGTRMTAIGVLGGLAATVVAFVGVIRGTRASWRASRANLPMGVTVLAVFGNLLMVGLGLLSAFAGLASFSRGRQLRRFGRVLLPPVCDGGAWAGLAVGEVDGEVAEQLASQWRENGRTEHASVAAFARLTLDMMTLGAPPELLAAAQKDALDEIRHTELCFSLARAIDGKTASPGPFPEASRARTLSGSRSIAIARLAVDSLVDGALHEGVSARIIAKLARQCEVPAIADALRTIARDEGRHAAHGWDVVEWCVAEGGDAVVSALRGAVSALPSEMRSPLPAAAVEGAWHRWGIHGHALEAAEYTAARDELTRRVARLAAEESRAA